MNSPKIVTEQLKNESGYSLVIVLLVIVVLSIMGVSIIGVTATNVKMSSGERDYQAVYYIAESGITKRLAELENRLKNTDVSNYDDIIISTENYEFSPNQGSIPTAEVKTLGEDGNYTIISTGTIGNRSRTVQTNFSISTSANNNIEILDNMAVFTNGHISLTGGATINGTVGSNLLGTGLKVDGKFYHIIFDSYPDGGATLNGKFTFDTNVELEDVVRFPNNNSEQMLQHINHFKESLDKRDSQQKYEMIELQKTSKDRETIELQKKQIQTEGGNKFDVILNNNLRINNYVVRDAHPKFELKLHEYNKPLSFNEIIIDSNYTLTINVGDSEKDLIVNHLNLYNGHIKLEGTGTLNIIVKDSITLGSGSINNNGQIDKLNIYLEENVNNISVGSNQKIFGSLIAEVADVSLSGGGGFQGHIVTGGSNVTVSGGVYTNSGIIYAPDAHVKFTGGAETVGAVIANTFEADGGVEITFPENKEDFPPLPGIGPSNGIDRDPIKEQ
ncbi:PilX N-terminal domain-containing pilus assembly protein [Evansella sp. AB-P1]|uniref:PilX N-terminal domain-containing pilus assembly protein n=1 Tax=Evansella sp. AB-P1 TaxID=3037653 RepID=UPI00241DD74A|nr:PilX N-terminal domain-containing pilus assembly protein [Evansella sp. AB-P1]MDG5786868.1 PilX N-terminal domain-containing pilus assembly protein [Evansella sp. AB-P1]